MSRENRSLRKSSPQPVDIDVVGLYDELAASWKLGSPDTTVPAWSRGSPKPVDIDVVGLYDELAPSWKLGSSDTTVPVWSRAIFG
jgi:7,8-dihydro-6-hydroxymethylpterin-pyrophosphokinase